MAVKKKIVIFLTDLHIDFSHSHNCKPLAPPPDMNLSTVLFQKKNKIYTKNLNINNIDAVITTTRNDENDDVDDDVVGIIIYHDVTQSQENQNLNSFFIYF